MMLASVLVQAQTVVGGLSAGTSPRGIAVNHVTNRVYVANEGSGTVRVLDRVALTSSTVTVGASPVAVAVNTSTNRIYVANFAANSVSVIDGSTNTVTATVATGTNPVALTVNPVTNKIYVANQGSANVTVIDGGNNTAATVGAGGQPISVAINAVTNRIYVANLSGNSVTVIDGANNSTTTVAVGTQPRAIALHAVANKIFVANSGSGNVTAIDGDTLATSTVAAGTAPRAVAVNPDANKVYVANGGSNDVTVIDSSTLATSTIAVGTNPYAVSVNPATGHAYVANQGSNNVTVIDAQSAATTTLPVGTGPRAIGINPVTNRIHVVNTGSADLTLIDGDSYSTSHVATGSMSYPVAVNPVSNKVFTGNYGTNTVTVMDGTSLAKVNVTVPANPRIIAVNTATNKAYVGSVNSATVTVIDGDSYTATPVTVDQVPVAMAVNPATNRIYVLTAAAKVTVIDGATLATSTVLTSNFPADIAVNPATNKIYVANANEVNVIDGVTNGVSNIAFGALNGKVAVNPLTNRVYVTNSNTNVLAVIDGATNGIITTLGTGTLPYALAVNAETNKVYVANHNSNSVSVIDGVTHSVVTVAVGANPNAIAVNPVTNEVYVANRNSNFITQFDGHYRYVIGISTAGNTWDVAVNPVTGRVFTANWSSDNVTVISPSGAPGARQATVSIPGGGATSLAAPAATISVCCAQSPYNPAVRGVYTRMHDDYGVFTATTGAGPFVIGLPAIRPGLNFGVVYPIDATEGSATNPGGDGSGGVGTMIGTPSVFAFTKVNPPSITTPTPLPNGAVNAAYNQTIAATGGAGALTFTSTGTWPPGVSMNSSGVISGTPTATGNFTVSVIATDASGSTSSRIYPFTIVAGLATAPTIGSATRGDRQATVTFSAPASDGGSPITSYQAISSPGNITASCTAPCSAITVTGLTNGFIYTFRVRAVNAVGAGPYSGNSSSVTPAGLPGAPPLTGVLAGNGEVRVSFTNAASNGALISSYTATASPGGSTATCIVMGSCTSIIVPGLTNGVAYTFTVAATNAVGTGPPSAPSSPVTPVAVPGPPVIGSATPGTGQVTVTFSTPAYEGGSPIQSYTAAVRSSAWSATCAAPCSSITITGVTNGISVDVVVTATNAQGTSLPSAVSNLVYVGGPPGAPSNAAATAGNAQATVTFTASSNNGYPITQYSATSSPGGITGSCSAPCTSITVSGLTNGTAYTFTVAAANLRGFGPSSAPSNSVTPLGPPAAPIITSALPPPGNLQTAYSHTFAASGSPVPTFAITNGNLPPGLALSAGGQLSGTPTATGNYTATVTASNGVTPAATQTFTISIQLKPQPITFGPYPEVFVGTSRALIAFGGGSGNPVQLTAGTPACSVSGSVVTGLAEGTCIILAFQAGNAIYAQGTGTATFEVKTYSFTGEAFSRLPHPGFGDCDVTLDTGVSGFAATPSVDPRITTAGRQLIFRFSAPVMSSAVVTVTDESGAAVGTVESVTGVANEVWVTLADILDRRHVKVTVDNVNGVGSAVAYLAFFAGDSSGSGAVTAADISAQKNRRGQSLTADNCRFDIDVSGAIDDADLMKVKARGGQALR